MAGPAKFLFEDLIVHRALGSPTKNLLNPRPRRLLNFFFPGFYKPLPSVTRVRLAAKIKVLQLDGTDTEGVFLTIRYAPEVRASKSLIAKIDGFRDMYGFNRNVSFSLLFAAVCFTIAAYVKGSHLLIHSLMAMIKSSPRLMFQYINFKYAGALLFYRYLKFFRQYSYELFNSYACMSEKGTS